MKNHRVLTPRPLSSSLASFASSAAVCAALLAASQHASGAPFAWDVDALTDGILTSGTGAWDNAALNFTNPADSIPHFAWSNTTNAADTAVFGGTAGTPPFTITVGTITAGGLQFDRPGYLLTGGTLTVGAPATIVTNAEARINSVIAGAAGLTLTGTSRLTLGGANTFTGVSTIGSGLRVDLANAAALGSTAAADFTSVLAGGTLNTGGQTVNNNLAPATPGKEIRIAGTGVGGIGALINDGVSQNNSLGKVVLTANATMSAGGTLSTSYNAGGQIVNGPGGRFDIRLNAAPTAGQKHLDLAGFTLTKKGTHLLALVNADVSDGNIIVDDGQLNLEAGTLMQGTGTITVNPNGKLGFWSISNAANITRNIVVNGGTIGDPTSTGSAQTVNSNIQFTGAVNPNFTAIAAAGTNLAGVISQSAFTGTDLVKRGGGLLIFSNAANTFSAPITIHAGNLQANYAAFTGGVAPAAPVALAGTPLGTGTQVTLAGGTLNVRVDGANDGTNQVFTIGKTFVVDRAPSGINLDRLTATGGTDKNLLIDLTFAAPSAANGFSIGQNQLTGAQGNAFRTQLNSVVMNSDSVLNIGDFTITGNITSTNRNSLVHAGGNSWGFIGGTTQNFNSVLNLGAAQLRIGSMFGTGVTSDTVTAGTGPILNAPNATVSFRAPTNIAAGQTVELVSQRAAQSTINLQNFTSIPAGFRAMTAGVLGIGGASAFGDINLGDLGDGTFRIGSNFGGQGNGTITGVITPGAGGVVRTGAGGTMTISGANRVTGSSILEVGSDLINGGFRTSGTGGAQNGTVVLTGANNYTGGTLVNRSSTLAFETAGSLGSGAVTAFGTITAQGAGGTYTANGTTNVFTPTFHGGSNVSFNNGGVTGTTDVNRWGDTVAVNLYASSLTLNSRNNDASVSNEQVGTLSIAGGSSLTLNRQNAVAGNVSQLSVDSITRVGSGTLDAIRQSGTGAGWGVGQFLRITGTAPAVVNGMVAPWITQQNNGPVEFSTLSGNSLIPLATYDQTVSTGTYVAGALDFNGTTGGKVDVTTADLTLTDDPTLYALRTAFNINASGANDTITIRSGGIINNATTGTQAISAAVVANNGTANSELIVHARGGSNLNLTGVLTAAGVTKFGAGTLSLNANNATTITGNISINGGVLQLHGPTATGIYNPAGTGPIQLFGGQLNLRSNNTAVTGTINPTLENTGVQVMANIPIATIDVNRSAADTASTGTYIFNPAVSAPGSGLTLQGSPGAQGQTLTVSGANYSLQFGSNAQNSFTGNVTINNAVTTTLNNAPVINSLGGAAPIITKSGTGNLIVGAVAGTAAPVGTQVHMNDGTLELRSVIAVGTGDQTTLVLNRGTLNLRRDSAGQYGTAGSGQRYPVLVNGNVTISTDRAGGTGTNYLEGLGMLTLNGNAAVTFNSGNGIYPDFNPTGGLPSAVLNGLPIIVSNIGAATVDTAVRFTSPVVGGGLVKLGGGHLHFLAANSTFDGGLYLNQGITRARAANALGTGPVIVNPGAVLDLNAANNLGATQPLTIRSNSNFLPMISMNADVAHPTGANVNATGAPLGIVGLSNTTGGTYNTPIDMGALYGGGWYLGGVSTGAYDARYTAATLGVGAGNTYRLGGGGLAFIFSVDTANVERNNLLTGASSNVVIGHDSGNIRGANTTTFQFVIGGTQNYGGTTVVHRGTVARITAANNGTQSGLSSSAVDVFGNLVLGSNASLVIGAGVNTNNVTLHPGSALHLDSINAGGGIAAANNNNRLGDTTNVALNGALLDLIGNAAGTTETVGNVTYSRGARIRVARNTLDSVLTLNSLTAAAGNGNTLSLQSSAAGTLGAATTSDRIIVATGAPTPVNGMVSPSIVNFTDNTFVTYGANGFANVTYDDTLNATYALGSLTPTDKVDVGTAALPLQDNPTIYSLRTNQSINLNGPFNTITLRSGGFIGTGGTISPHLVFNDGTANIEGRMFITNTVTMNGTLTANGITKFGNGNLTVNVPQPQHATGWTVNSGTLQFNDPNGLGQSVPGNAVTLNATQTTGGSVAQTLNQTNLTLNYNSGSPELVTFTGGPITVINEATIRSAGGDDRNLQIPNVTLDSTGTASSVGFTWDVPNNRFRATIPTLTLADNATIRVLDSGATTDTGRITTAAVNSLVGNGVQLLKVGNRTLELAGDNSTTFLGGKITIAQSGIRVRHNGALGNAASTVSVERNATLEIATSNFTPTATVTQLPGSIERWSAENARGTGTYNLPSGVNLQLNTNVVNNMTIGLNGGTIEGFLYIDHPAAAVVRTIASTATVNLLQDSFVGQNILQGFGYDAGRQPTVAQPFGDNITGATLRIEGNVTGAFNLTKTGLDTVVLAGAANSYRNTTVEAGVLRIGVPNGLPSAGVLTTRYAGIFDLYGNNQSVVGLGSLTAGPNPGGVAVGSSGRILNSAATDNILTVNNTTNYTYNGTIEENVALTKSGAGTLTLGGANTYRGDTTVAGGTLALTGAISGTSSVEVQTGATFDVSAVTGGYTLGAAQLLRGTGTVAGAVSIDGTVSPGGATPGTLTMTGLADFNAGSTLAIEIASASQFDKLVANSVTLDGTVNLAINLSYTPAGAPVSFLIVDNTSATPIGGAPGRFTFGGNVLAEGASFLVGSQLFSITYQGGTGGNDVLLTVPEPTTACLALVGVGLSMGLRRFRRKS